jgi:hypothetical protein
MLDVGPLIPGLFHALIFKQGTVPYRVRKKSNTRILLAKFWSRVNLLPLKLDTHRIMLHLYRVISGKKIRKLALTAIFHIKKSSENKKIWKPAASLT